VNCNELQQYIQHKLFGLNFTDGYKLEKDALLIPSGADSIGRINISFENQKVSKDPKEPFEEVIKNRKENQSKILDSFIIEAEEDQVFLNNLLNSPTPLPDKPETTPPLIEQPSSPLLPTTSHHQITNGEYDSYAKFFNRVLQPKTDFKENWKKRLPALTSSIAKAKQTPKEWRSD